MYDYTPRQRKPTRWLANLCVVVALHALLLWAISSGLATRVVKIAKAPVEAMLLQEVQPVLPPPPPAPAPPPPVQPPKTLPPPPAYVPPPVAPLNTPAPVNAIAAVSSKPQPEASPAPVVQAPPSPPSPPAPPAPVARTAAEISAANCEKPEYPSASRRLEEEGTVTLKFLVGADGKVKESAVDKSSGFKRLDEAARQGLAKCKFKPGTENGHAVEAWASMKYTWKLE